MTEAATPARQQPQQMTESRKLRAWFEQDDVRQMVNDTLPWGNADKFIAQMLVALDDPKLVNCTAKSKFKAVHLCATLGLIPALQHVALFERNVKVNKNPERWEKQVAVMPQWQGFDALMRRVPGVLDIQRDLVHVNDEFSYRNGVLYHEYDPFSEDREIKSLDDIRGGWLRVIFSDGRPDKIHFVSVAKIKKRRLCSKPDRDGNYPIWDAWPEEQALKTLYRDAYQRRVVPIDTIEQQLASVAGAEDEVLDNDPRRLQAGFAEGTVIDVHPQEEHVRFNQRPSRSQRVQERLASPLDDEPPTSGEADPASEETEPAVNATEEVPAEQHRKFGEAPKKSEAKQAEAQPAAEQSSESERYTQAVLNAIAEAGSSQLLDEILKKCDPAKLVPGGMETVGDAIDAREKELKGEAESNGGQLFEG